MNERSENHSGNGTARTGRRAVFLVLHYLAEPVTRLCMETLLKNFPPERDETAVVLVDNASPDDSGARLAETYEGREGVHVLLLPENRGFAEGNNAGYAFVRERYDAEFVIALNNDVLIRDPAFLEIVRLVYDRTGFAVLGPDIRNPKTGQHESPLHEKVLTQSFVERKLRQFHEDNRCYFIFHYLLGPLRRGLKRLRWGDPAGKPWEEPLEGAVPQGSCLVLSQDFLRARERMYRPGTFLYFEEDILALECARAGLKLYYTPELFAEHLRDRSVKADLPSRYGREKRKHLELERSMRVFLEVCAEAPSDPSGGGAP